MPRTKTVLADNLQTQVTLGYRQVRSMATSGIQAERPSRIP
jgi:hypothetical protein